MCFPGAQMVTLFHVRGPIEYLDESGSVTQVDTAQPRFERFQRHSDEHGLNPGGVIVM
jgi:hypothetical protein